MVREFDWINAYDWETSSDLNGRKLSELVRYEKIFEGSLKSAQSNLPKKVSFYTWWRDGDFNNPVKLLMYVLSFTDGDFYPQKTKLYNFAKLAPNLRNIVYESPNPYIAGTEYDEIGFPWAPSLSKAFQRISRKRTVTSLNYPFGFYNEERVNNKIINNNNKRTFVISSVDYDLSTDEEMFFEPDLLQDFVFEYRVDDIGDITDMQEIADKIVEDISDETGLLVLGFYFQEKMSDGTLVDLDAESFWGNSGSGVLVVARDTQRILLGLRSWDVMEPNTWGNFGGAIGISDDGEPEEALPPEDNALKEMAEEINYTGPIEMIPSFTYRNNSFTYYNYIGMVDSESQIALNQFNWEISELRWFTLDEVLSLPNLHFGISELMRQEKMITFNAPGIADEEYRTFFKKDFELTSEPQFVLFEELPVITQDDIVYMATHPTWGNPILAEEYWGLHPNYFKRDLQGIEFPTFNANMNDINFPLTQRNRHTPTILKYLEQLKTSNAPPILISGNEFIDGGHRFLAYELAGRRTIPVVDIGNLLTIDLREYLDTGEGDSKELIHQFSAEDNAQSITYDDFGQPYITLYHAGTMDNHELISIIGLRTNLPGWDPKTEFETYDNEEGIYFTTNLDKAIKWIGWKYRQEFCDYDGGEHLDETELIPFPNEVAGVVYAVQFPLIKRREILKSKKWNRVKEQYDTQSSYSTLQLFPEDLSRDEIVEDAWVSKQSIPIDELEVVGFYSLPICFSQGWNDGGFGITEITKSEAMDIHNRGFTMERVEWSPNSGDYEPISDSKYKPRYHLTLPRDSMYSSYKGWFAAESVPMADWDKLTPVELVELSQFPSGDDHMDGWDMYLPQDWPHHEVLDLAGNEYYQMEKAYLEANDLRYLDWQDRHNLPFSIGEIYAKYFDFWYIPGVANTMSGGGYRDIYQSISDAYSDDYWEEESKKRGLPFNVEIPLDEAAKYFSPLEINWAREAGRDTMHVYKQPIVDAFIDEHLALGREVIMYAPVLAAAAVDAKVGTDASRGARLVDGWHRDAYANLLYDQDPSQGGTPTVFFKPKKDFASIIDSKAAESVPMSDWDTLSPAELAELSHFPSGDDHMDGWDMYLPQDWPHWDVLEQAENEYYDMEKKYKKDNDIRLLSRDDRKNLPYTMNEIYAKYFDFWYIPAVANSMSGGGYGQIFDSIQGDDPNYWKLEAEKRGLPFNETIPLEEAAKYFSNIEDFQGEFKLWSGDKAGRTIQVRDQIILKVYIDEYLSLGREVILSSPVIAAAPVDADVGADVSEQANLLDGWHRDAYAGLLYDQDPSQVLEGPPTVFFKPKEEYL